MKFLLDTHVWFWAQNEPSRLGPQCRAALLDTGNELWVSPVSCMELARLTDAGRLDVGMDLVRWMDEGLRACGARELPVDNQAAIEAYRLPEPLYGDPADRLLIAQARLNDSVLVTADRALLRCRHVRSIEARR